VSNESTSGTIDGKHQEFGDRECPETGGRNISQ